MVTDQGGRTGTAETITSLKAHRASYVTIDALAAYLTVNRRTVMKWIDAGTLPAYQFHGSSRSTWRIRTADAIAFEARARFSPDESATEA